jgi:hypothetical protein
VTAYAAHLMRRQGASWLAAFLAATLMATGSWFFVSTGWLSYTDSWYLLGLLAVAFSPWRTTIVITGLLEPFIDERFVLTLPLVFIVRQIYFERFERRHRHAVLLDAAAIAATSFPYIALRLLLLLLRSSDTGSNSYIQDRFSELKTVHLPWTRWLDGWWQGLRCAWVLVFFAVCLPFGGRSRYWAAALAAVCLATITMAMLIAADIGRTNSAPWPAGLLGLFFLMKWRPVWARFVLPLLLCLNLLLPARNVSMYFSTRVNSFAYELQAYRDAPEVWGIWNVTIWRAAALQELDRNNPYNALHDLNVAVRLDDRSAEALADRALFYANFNRLGQATADADAALAIDPMSINVKFARGNIYSRRNDPNAAAPLLRWALDHAPSDWMYREACQALLRKLPP